MPTTLCGLALTVDDIRDATHGELQWSDAIDYWDCPQLPAVPGVYVWAARDVNAVIYIGKTTSKHGLRERLGDEIGWVLGAAQDDPALRHERWAGHARTVLAMDAQAYWAATDIAADTERALLQLSLRLTGLVPIVNGGAWWNRGLRFDRARVGQGSGASTAWKAARSPSRAGHRLPVERPNRRPIVAHRCQRKHGNS